MTMPEFIPWNGYDVLLDRFRRTENFYFDIAVEASLCWEQYWIPVKKLYDVVGMDRLITMESWENVSFCRECVSPALPPSPGAETEIVTVIQTLAELVSNNHKEDSADVQKLLEDLYCLKLMYPKEFSDVIKTRAERMKNIHSSFLEIHNKN